METALDNLSGSQAHWGPYQLRANARAILRLSLGTAGAVSTALVIPDVFALMPSAPDAFTLACRIAGLWGYAYILWAAGFLAILHLARLAGTGIGLDGQGLSPGGLAKRISWQSIEAVTVTERKMFSRVFFVPAYQMTIHIVKPDGKRAARQIASFQFLPQEFYSLFFWVSKFATGAQPASLDAFVFKDPANPALPKMADSGRMKSILLTILISFGLIMFLGRKAAENYAFNMGNKYFAAARYDIAIGYFSAATAIDFAFAPAWDQLARCEFRQGDIDDAEHDWQTALKWRPDLVESKLGLAKVCMLRGKLEQAEKLVATANRLAPLDEAAYISRAQIDALTGKTAAAVKALETFIHQKQGREQAICILARCYINEGQLGKAEQLIRSNPSLLRNPYTRPACTMVTAELDLVRADTESAGALLKPLRRYAYHEPDLLIDFAKLETADGDLKAAHRDIEAALRINPDGPLIALAAAALSAKENDVEKADYWLGKAMSFRFKDSCLLSACAQLLYSQGKKEEAVEAARAALRLDPDNLVARRIVSRSQANERSNSLPNNRVILSEAKNLSLGTEKPVLKPRFFVAARLRRMLRRFATPLSADAPEAMPPSLIMTPAGAKP